MAAFILRRLLSTLPVLLFVAVFVFLILRLAPGDPAALIVGDMGTEADIARVRQSLGLEGPLPAVAIGAVVEEEITVRDEKPFFPAGEVYREYVGRPVPVLRTRIVIDAPESLPIKHITNLLPNAQIRETRANGRVRWYPLLIAPFLPVTLLQSLVSRTATMAFIAQKPTRER